MPNHDRFRCHFAVVLFLMIFDCRHCDVSFFRCWLPDVEQPEISKEEIKITEIMNLFLSFLILIFYVCGGVKLISSYKNNSVCIFLFITADKNNAAGKKRND